MYHQNRILIVSVVSAYLVPVQNNADIVSDTNDAAANTVVDFLTAVKKTHNTPTTNLSKIQLQSVLSKECFSVQHLKEIGQLLQLDSLKLTSSFKESYKLLAHEIHSVLNISFAMVEGLHRLYTVRNVLEGTWLKENEEPNTRNSFLRSRITIRVSLLNEFDLDKKAIFHSLSLFTCNVKNSSVHRTIQDELSRLTHEIKYSNKLVDLLSNKEFYKQRGGSDKEQNHILYSQRLFIYDFICSFILNKTNSTVLYKFHCEHVNGVMSNNSISDKATYLAISPESACLSNKNIITDVALVVLTNIKSKAFYHSIIYTRGNAKMNDLTMKPVAHEIKVIISFYNLASVNMSSIKQATDIFASNRKFNSIQTSSDVDVIDTMATIVFSISSIVEAYGKAIGLASTEVYVSKVEQLLCMNLFRDIIDVVLKTGHYPEEVKLDAIKKYYVTVDDVTQESTLIATLKAWEMCICSYLNSKRDPSDDDLSQWRSDLFKVLQFKTYPTYVRNGRFGSQTFDSYSVNNKMTFSFFMEQLKSNSLEECFKTSSQNEQHTIVYSPPVAIGTPTTGNTNSQQEVSEKEKTPMASTQISTSTPARSLPSRSATKRSYSLVDESDGEGSKPVAASVKKRKTSVKAMLKVPDEVVKYYSTVLDREKGDVPVTHDIEIVKKAWKEALSKISTASDLVNIWLYHKDILMSKLLSSDSNGSDEQMSDNEETDDNHEVEEAAKVGEE